MRKGVAFMGLGEQRLSGSVEPFPCRNLCGRGSPESRPFLPRYTSRFSFPLQSISVGQEEGCT